MEYDLFIHGTPADKETLPMPTNNADSLYIESLFNMPSKADYHSADFYVEASPHDKRIFYTYMHRRNVSGMPRENAYIALVLRISGNEYFSDLKVIFNILEQIYQQFILGKIITINGNSEKYISTIKSQEDLRLMAEDALGEMLRLRAPTTRQISEFPSSKGGAINIMSIEEDNTTILNNLWKSYAVHLIPAKDGWEKQKQLLQKDKTNLNTTITALQSEKSDLINRNTSLSSTNESLRQLNEKLKSENENLRKQKKPETKYVTDEKLVATIYQIEEKLNEFNYGPSHSTKKSIILIAILVITLIGTGFSIYSAFSSKGADDSERYTELEKQCNELSKFNSDLNEKYKKLDAEHQACTEKLQRLNELLASDKSKENKPSNIKIDVGGKQGTFTVGKHYKVTLSREAGEGARWDITETGKQYLRRINGDSISMIAPYNGNEILLRAESKDGKIKGERTIKINPSKSS